MRRPWMVLTTVATLGVAGNAGVAGADQESSARVNALANACPTQMLLNASLANQNGSPSQGARRTSRYGVFKLVVRGRDIRYVFLPKKGANVKVCGLYVTLNRRNDAYRFPKLRNSSYVEKNHFPVRGATFVNVSLFVGPKGS